MVTYYRTLKVEIDEEKYLEKWIEERKEWDEPADPPENLKETMLEDFVDYADTDFAYLCKDFVIKVEADDYIE